MNGEGIRFDEDKHLRDGHHRLQAIIEANVPVLMTVTRGVKKEDADLYDRNRPRSVTNILQMMGMNKALANNFIVSLCNTHYNIVFNKRIVNECAVREFIDRNEKELTFICSIYNRQSTGYAKVAGVMYAMFCALKCGVSEKDIEEFIECVGTGIIPSVNKSAAIKLRNALIDYRVRGNGGGYKFKEDTCLIAENALYDYLRNYPRKKAYTVCEKIYSNTKAVKEA